MKIVHFFQTSRRVFPFLICLAFAGNLCAQNANQGKILTKSAYDKIKPDHGDGGITPPPPLSTHEEEVRGFNFYPSPVTSTLNIDFSDGNARTVRIYNLTGNKIYEQRTTELSVSLDLSYFPTGVYLLNVADKTYRILKV